MAFFGGKKKDTEPVFRGILGVDIGTVGVKVVELTLEKEKPRLTTYGYAEMTEVSPDLSTLTDIERVRDMIKRVCKDAGVKTTKAIAALPASEVFHTIVSIPASASSDEELRQAIEAQARKVFPLPVEELVLDSVVLNKEMLKHAGTEEKDTKPAAKDQFIKVFLTGAPKVLIQKYIDVFTRAGLELISLETEVMSLVRALVSEEDAQIMIVDIGGKRSNVIVADGGIPFLTRGIKGGGEEITRALAKSMGSSEADAERAKRDLSYGDQVLPRPLQEALQPIVHEIRYALQMYADQGFHNHNAVEKILITGGSAHLPGIDTHFTAELNTNIYIANPWTRIAYPHEAKAILEEVGPRLTVAVGLALRILEKGTL